MSGFSVVAMMRESPEIVQHFVDYYVGLGASELFIFHNGAAAELPELVGATATHCSPEFWAAYGGEPRELEARQRICYAHAYARCRSDWLLVVDADEFVFGDRPFGPALASVPDTVEAIIFPTAEAVWGPGDSFEQAFGCTHFRTAWTSRNSFRLFGPLIYGRTCRHLKRGLAGHDSGKNMVRTGLSDIKVDLHVTTRNAVSISQAAAEVSPALAGFFLGHFDAISLTRWEHKWRLRNETNLVLKWMKGARHRLHQQRVILESIPKGRSREVFRAIYGVSALQFQLLTLLGKGFRRKDLFKPSVAVSAGEPAPAPRRTGALK